jgi:D-alanyl-D-alanine carboxypeptidase (penicillin-binding protein 5/6)
MKRRIALALALLLVFFLAAHSDNGNTPNGSTTAPPPATILASPDKPLLQGDAGSPRAEDDGQSFGQTSEAQTASPREEVNSADTEDIERISVDIAASNAYVLAVDTDSVLYEKNSNARIAPASTVKMLTALTVLEYCPLDELFTVGAEIEMIAADSSKAWLRKGDKMTVKQLLIALLLPSGNDAAYTLAVNAGKRIAGKHDIGTRQAIGVFVDAMNQKAKEIGAASSNFTNPDGYDEDGQYTTAFDLAQIAKACLDNDVLAEIMSSYKISDTWSNGREVTYTSTNELLNPDSRYYYSKAIGLKTGSTGDAGSCLVSAAYIDGRTYICVVMGSSAEIRFSDSLTVFGAIDPTVSLPQVSNTAPSAASAAPAAPGGLRMR